MAEKKAVIMVYTGALPENDTLAKFKKKAACVAAFSAQGLGDLAGKIGNASVTDPEGIAAAFEKEERCMILHLSDADALTRALDNVDEAADRKTTQILATENALYMAGFGINKKAGQVARKADAQDVAATLCYISDLALPEDCTGAILYQVMKDPNLKLKEIKKLEEAIERMEAAMQRDNREPWDKHDCA